MNDTAISLAEPLVDTPTRVQSACPVNSYNQWDPLER